MYCEKCKLNVSDSMRICPECGNRSFAKTKTSQKEVTESPKKIQNSINTNDQVRPWIRLWARYTDIILFAIFLGFFWGVFFPNKELNEQLFGLSLIPLWILVEPFLLSKFGNTPGKKLFRVAIKHKTKRDISFADAMTRSISVAWRGLALGLPIVYLITSAVAYSNLTKNNETTWDRDNEFKVTHEKLGTERIIIILVLLGLLIAFIIWADSLTQTNHVYY